MEGDRIIATLKSQDSWNNLSGSVVRYLGPVLQTPLNQPIPTSHLTKYELFSNKLLRQCVESLPVVSDPKRRTVLVEISQSCCSSLQVCAGTSNKIPPLTFETILLHLSNNYLMIGNIEHYHSICRLLHSRLCSTDPLTSSSQNKALLKHVSDLLWRGAAQIEKDAGEPKQVLQLRRESVQSLLASGSCDMTSILDRMMRADSRFTHSKHSILDRPHQLHTFHSLLPTSSIFSNHLPCHKFIPSLQYLLHRAVLSIKVMEEGGSEGDDLIQQAISLCEDHEKKCKSSKHLVVSIQVLAVQLWSVVSSDIVAVSLLKQLAHFMTNVSVLQHSPALPSLVESLELVITALIASKQDLSSLYLPSRAFPDFKTVLLGTVACLELMLKTTPSGPLQLQVLTKQLRLLSSLSGLIVELLASDEEEIESLRDSVHVDSPLPEDSLKAILASSCLPVLQRSHDIINKATGLLPNIEHKWLGNDAHRLAHTLAKEKLYSEACPLLELSCQEIVTWCHDDDKATTLKRSQESRLLDRFTYLAELYHKSGKSLVAMKTLCKALRELPSEQIESESAIKQLVTQWIQLKQTSQDKDLAHSELIGRSFLSLLDQCQVAVPLKIKVQYLETELVSCQRLRHPIHSSLVAIIVDLLSLYSKQDMILPHAHLTTQLASISRSCSPQCHHKLPQSDPLNLLDQAIEAVETLLSSHIPQTQLQQVLGTAYLWKGIIMAEDCMRSSEGMMADSGEDGPTDLLAELVASICLSAKEEEALFKEDITQSFFNAVEAWQAMWLTVQGETSPLNLEKLFYQPMDMLKQLLLTGLVCSCHSQVSLALKCASILLNLCCAASEDIQNETAILQSQGLALYSELIAMEGGVSPAIPALQVSRGHGKREGFLTLHWHLVLAHIYLSQEKLDACRDELLHVLEHPMMMEHVSTDSLLLCAKAKLLTCEYLLYSTLDLKPSSSLLRELKEVSPPSASSSDTFHLLPLELAMDAVKLLWQLANHRSVQNKGKNDSLSIDMSTSRDQLSCDGMAWSVLLTLLRGLQTTARLHILQGLMAEAYYYSREGAMLARTLQLHGWYCDFLLLLCEVFVERDKALPSTLLFSQTARLLDCSDFIQHLTPTQPAIPSSLASVDMDNAMLNDDEVVSCGDLSCEAEEESTIKDMANLDPQSLPIKEHLWKVCVHPQSCVCSSCSSSLHLCHTTKLICLSSRRALHACHVTTDHVTNIEAALVETDKFLTQQIPKTKIDSQPLNITLIMGAPKSRSKVNSRIQRSGKGKTKTPSSSVSGGVRDHLIGQRLQWEVACARAQCLLILRQPELAKCVLSEALVEIENGIDYKTRLILAELHHYMGVALLQLLENAKPDVLEKVWSGKGCRNQLLNKCIEEFLTSYQFCYPVVPTILLRETCLWLALLLNQPCHTHHFLSLSQQISLSHQTVLALGKKIRKLGPQLSSKSGVQHVMETRQVLTGTPSPSPHHSLLTARTLLLPPHSSSSLLSLFPPHWTLLTLTLSPKTHPSNPTYLIITKVTSNTAEVKVKGQSSKRKPTSHTTSENGTVPVISVLKLCGDELENTLHDFSAVLEEEGRCVTLESRRDWWNARRRLDQQLEHCLSALHFQGRQDWITSNGPVLLILGRRLQQLPWESLPLLQDSVITRMPSLAFAAAHKALVGDHDDKFIDVRSTYFVVNPQGDLKKTEKLFGEWFSSERGWEGVIGKVPETNQLSTALQEKDLYIYCGHSVGRFLGNATLRSLHCHAAALLIGCSSAQLAVDGRCDPSGPVLSYLLAGCPVLVGCLWNVTDGDIDRFCQSLIESLLSSTTSGSFPVHVNTARSACKLQWLVGAAPILYGLPLKLIQY